MAKITALPELIDADGEETVVVLKGQQTVRAKMKALAAAAVAPIRAAMAFDLARVESNGAIDDSRRFALSGLRSSSGTNDGRLINGIAAPGALRRRTTLLGAIAPLALIVGIGNSLIENGVAAAVGREWTSRTGIPVQTLNLGRSGTTSRAIEANLGATIVNYQPIDGFIPATTTPVVLLPNDPGPLQAFGGAGGQTEGYLANVRGIFNWAPGGPMTFTRAVAGVRVGVPEPTPYQPIFYDRNALDGFNRSLYPQRRVVASPFAGLVILWGLANDIFDLPTPTAMALMAVRHYERLIAQLVDPNAFVILAELNTRTAVKGSRAYQQVLAINAALARRWPNNYVDVRSVLNAQGTADDKAKDIPPAALLYDQYLHPNDAGRAIIAKPIVDLIIINHLFDDVMAPVQPPRPIVRAARSGGGVFQTVAGSFATLQINAAQIDNALRFDPATYAYVIPEAGTYALSAKMRADNAAAGISYGLGVGIANDDDAAFLWSMTNGKREGLLNTRVVDLARGDRVRAYAYADAAINLTSAEMSIHRLS